MHFQLFFLDVEHAVEGGTLTPLCYYGDLRDGRPAHEQDDVGVSGLAQYGHFVLECLQLCFGRVCHLEFFYRNRSWRG